MMPRILVNATTLIVGGGVQVGVSFIEYASKLDKSRFNFLFAVSENIYKNLPKKLQEDSRVYEVVVSPSRIFKGHRSRLLLKKLEKKYQPNVIYSLGFPSYVRFNQQEIGRYTNPWEIFPNSLAWGTMPLVERINVILKTQYRLLWARSADFLETQTEAAKSGIIKKLKIPSDRVKVIPNSPNPRFLNDKDTKFADNGINRCKNIFCLSAAYRHKNLKIIPEVAEILKNNYGRSDFHFLLTLPFDCRIYREIVELSKRLNVCEMVENIGPLSLDRCVEQYKKIDLVFLPTLLEVFSATYVEAMAMSKPIVTTDLDFSRSVCRNAAIYYEAASPTAAAKSILSVSNNKALYAELIEYGRKQLSTFPSSEKKHEMILEWLREVVEHNGA